MTEPTRQPHSIRPQHTTLAAAVAGLALSTALGGCSAIEPGVPLQPEPPVALNTPESDLDAPAIPSPDSRTHSVDPADLMFQSSEPFARTASDVNVFGELDGLGPSPFDAGGKAGFQQITVVEEGYDADQTVSPDGKWLLFSSTRHSERPEIYLQRIGGQAVTQLTADAADDSFPHFSPDGTQIVFASNRSGNWDVYVMDVEGKNVRPLTRSPAQEIHPCFSPDGTRVVYSALGRGGQWELWTLNLQTDERRMIGYGLFPEWSPRHDKDVIAFQRARQRGTRWFSVWTLELADGEARDVTEIAYSPSAAIVAPTWSPDGRRVAFSSIVDPQVAEDAHGKAAHRSAQQDVWTANADGSDRRKLTDGKGTNASPAWGSDGRIYFVSNRSGHEAIWSAPAGFPTGDVHARRPRLPDSYDVPPSQAETASKRIDVPIPPAVREEPKPVLPATPLITIQPPQAKPQPARATKAEPPLPPQTSTGHVVVDEPIVMQPVEPDGHHADHGDPEDAPANTPMSAHEDPHAHDEPAAHGGTHH